MGSSTYLLPCYALVVTALVLFFSVDVTEAAIREYQFDVSSSIYLCNKQTINECY